MAFASPKKSILVGSGSTNNTTEGDALDIPRGAEVRGVARGISKRPTGETASDMAENQNKINLGGPYATTTADIRKQSDVADTHEQWMIKRLFVE